MYWSKIDIGSAVSSGKPLVLDVGCGSNKCNSEAIGIDLIDYPEVDVVGDVFSFLRNLPASCVSEIHAHHFLEHIESTESFLSECNRVLAANGLLNVSVPHFSNPYFFSDPTHVQFFGLYSMNYLVSSNLFRRTVPNYQKKNFTELTLEDVSLSFKASRHFPISYAAMRLFGVFANWNRATREFYERWMSGLIPCYEVRYRLRKSC